MITAQVKKRRAVLISILVALLLFDVSYGIVFYLGNQSLAKQKADSQSKLAELDKQIEITKAKKVAEKKAAEAAAAAQKASADAALTAQQSGQVVTPAGCAIHGANGDPNAVNVVVNKKHCFNPIDFTPSDLVTAYGATISTKAQADFMAMYQAASSAGAAFTVTSSFRSYSNQVATYNNWVRVNGSTDAADTVSARPGYSEHQTGYAVDISAGGCSLECLTSSAQYKWMQANAATYGFIERYPSGLESVTGYSPEAWHWRYVGPTTAQEMKAKGIKTLEQLWNISGGSY